jgi:hypothetical protein
MTIVHEFSGLNVQGFFYLTSRIALHSARSRNSRQRSDHHYSNLLWVGLTHLICRLYINFLFARFKEGVGHSFLQLAGMRHTWKQVVNQK